MALTEDTRNRERQGRGEAAIINSTVQPLYHPDTVSHDLGKAQDQRLVGDAGRNRAQLPILTRKKWYAVPCRIPATRYCKTGAGRVQDWLNEAHDVILRGGGGDAETRIDIVSKLTSRPRPDACRP